MVTDLQKKTIKAIVRIFESGKIKGDYSAVAQVKGDAGGVSFGVSQASLNSGNLGKLLQEYAKRASLPNKQLLAPYLDDSLRMASRLNFDRDFAGLLAFLGKDPIMQQTQDDFFDKNFWQPALVWANKFGFTLPLSLGVIYDSKVHGSLDRVANSLNIATPVNGGDEKTWIKTYLIARRAWVVGKGGVLASTTYRMNTFLEQITKDNWQLDLPVRAKGVNIFKEDLL